jgi:hypothetical protein
VSAADPVTNSAPEAVSAAIEAGGNVRLAFDGTVSLSRTLVIVTNTSVDASGRNISFDGGERLRHFAVTNGVTLRLINLSLINGKGSGPTGALSKDGEPGYGGSVYNHGGIVELVGCKFLGNQVTGGDGGPVDNSLGSMAIVTRGAPGFGGTIYSFGGEVRATNCVFANNSARGGQSKGSLTIRPPVDGDASGGAIYAYNARLTFVGVTFSSNSIVHDVVGHRASGGALADEGGSSVVVSGCTFVDNQVVGAALRVALEGRSIIRAVAIRLAAT